MKRIAKILILAIVLPVILSGCNSDGRPLTDGEISEMIEEAQSEWNETYNNMEQEQDDEYIEEIGQQILRCFEEKDVEGLKAMFSLSSQKNYYLDAEIEIAFEKYRGKTAYTILTNKALTDYLIDNGEFTLKRFTPKILDVVTDSSDECTIGFALYQVCDDSPDKIGISVMVIRDSQDNKLAVIGGD